MKEKLQIVKHANLVDEAFIILCHLANNDELDQLREDYRDSYLEIPDRYNNIWDTIFEIYNVIREELMPKKEQIEYYFKVYNDNFFSYAALAFLLNYQNPNNQLLPYEERVRNMKEEDRIKLYALFIDGGNGSPDEKLVDYESFVRFLEDTSYDKAVKWDILKIYHKQEEAYNEVTAILRKVVDIIERNYHKQIAGIEQYFYDYWQEIQEKQDIIQLLHDSLKIEWKTNENGIILLPILFEPFSVLLACKPDTDREDVLRFGILMDSRFIISRDTIVAENIVNFGKLLCDKSKVDILELTAIKPCYGKEIANELNLSTATISYHVNALIKQGLLQTVLDSNRVYYSLNTEKLSQYLEGIKKYFTKK